MSAIYLARSAPDEGDLLDRDEAPAAAPCQGGVEDPRLGHGPMSAGWVLLVDPKRLRRSWLACSVNEWAGAYACVAVASARELAAVAPDEQRSIRLVVVSIGGADVEEDWVVEELSFLRERFPDLPIVVFADRDDAQNVRAALRMGVRAYLPTNTDPEVARSALRLVLAGGAYAPPALLLEAEQEEAGERGCDGKKLQPCNGVRSKLAEFTPRQREVLRLLGEGRPNKVIARRLGMCESTVKVHVRQIMRKLGASNRTEVALKLRELVAAEGGTGSDEDDRRRFAAARAPHQKMGVSKRIGNEILTA